MIGWKVVRHEGGVGTGTPLMVSATKLVFCAVYKRGTWTYPPRNCGPLTVFSSKDEAIIFSKSAQAICPATRSIWRVEYEPMGGEKVWTAGDQAIIGDVWGYQELSLGLLPYGTQLASRVKLLEKEQAS